MGERPSDATGIDKMERHTPVYPLPLEIQQMERSETVCQYCGVSYLVLHEIQRLQERLREAERELESRRAAAEREAALKGALQEAERELESRRGAAEREAALKGALQEATAQLAQLEASHVEQAQRAKCLDLQLVERQARLESASAQRDVTERELGKARGRCQLLSGRSQLQVEALRKCLSVLCSCRRELQEVQRNHAHLLTFWKGWSMQLLQTSREADAERAELQRAVGGAHAEVTCLREELRDLGERLLSSESRAQELQNRVQNQEELQSHFQEVQTQLLELKEKVKSLHVDLQDSLTAKEHMETTLLKKCKEADELHSKQIQFEKEQRARLSADLGEKEKSLLWCQQRCQSLQKELQDLEQHEEERTQERMQAESERTALRRSLQQAHEEISTLTQQSEAAALVHRQTTQQLAEELEQRAQIEAQLEREQAHAELRLKEKEQELRMEREMELHSEREKSRELLRQYQREAEDVRTTLPSLVQAATLELRADVSAAEEKLKEAREGRAEQEELREREALRFSRMVSELEQQLLQARGDGQRGALLQAQLRQELEQMRQDASVLQEENALLQETVRRECEERGELTAALTLAHEKLLEIGRTSANAAREPRLLGPPGPLGSTERPTKERGASGEAGRGCASWHGRGSQVSLPRLLQERTASVSQARIALVMGRKGRC